MIDRLKAPISIVSSYNHKTRVFQPNLIFWEGRKYQVNKIGYHHMVRTGRLIYHVFSVETNELYFRLIFNAESLAWEVSEISDGEIN